MASSVTVRGNFRRECYLLEDGYGFVYTWRGVRIPWIIWAMFS